MELTPEQRSEIEALREETFKTRRVTVSTLEEILYEPIPILDYMGDDAAIVQADQALSRLQQTS